MPPLAERAQVEEGRHELCLGISFGPTALDQLGVTDLQHRHAAVQGSFELGAREVGDDPRAVRAQVTGESPERVVGEHVLGSTTEHGHRRLEPDDQRGAVQLVGFVARQRGRAHLGHGLTLAAPTIVDVRHVARFHRDAANAHAGSLDQ